MFGVHDVLAMGGQSGEGSSGFGAMLPLVLMFVVVYLLIIRPQHKKQKRHKVMIDALKKGDRVVTSGGVHGTIIGIKEKENILVMQVAKDVRIEVSRGSISQVNEKK